MKSHTDRTVEQLILILDIVTEILKFLDKPRKLQRLDQDALTAESSSAVLQSDRCDREQHPLPRRSEKREVKEPLVLARSLPTTKRSLWKGKEPIGMKRRIHDVA